MVKKLGSIGASLVVVVSIFGWLRTYSSVRATVLQGGVTLQSLHNWWVALTYLYAGLFVLTNLFVFVFTRMLSKRLDLYFTVACAASSLAGWLLFALTAITSDPASLPVLSSIGLGSLHNWLEGIAFAWMLLWLYTLFTGVDRARVGG
jgi:hypothetical protein